MTTNEPKTMYAHRKRDWERICKLQDSLDAAREFANEFEAMYVEYQRVMRLQADPSSRDPSRDPSAWLSLDQAFANTLLALGRFEYADKGLVKHDDK